MAHNIFKGLGIALITPFTSDGSVDYNALKRIIDYQLDNGADFLCILATTGETPCLTKDEKSAIKTLVVNRVKGRVPILMGCGGNNTRAVVEEIRETDWLGVSGVLSVCPYYNKPSQEGLYRHFKAIAESTELPIILYNVPGRVGVSIQPETIKRLTDVCPNIVGVKDAAGNWDQVTKEKILLPDDFMIYSGDDAFTLPVLAAGGVGVISVASHVIGEDLLSMIDAFEKGNLVAARRLHLKMYPIMKGMFFIASPIPVKTAVNLIGQPGGNFRLPMVAPTKEEESHVRTLLENYGFLL